MSTIHQFKCETEGVSNVVTQLRLLLAIPPNFFAIMMGLAGLAAITLLIGGIALRSFIALRQGTFLPAS
jgi:hypothetical protein